MQQLKPALHTHWKRNEVRTFVSALQAGDIESVGRAFEFPRNPFLRKFQPLVDHLCGCGVCRRAVLDDIIFAALLRLAGNYKPPADGGSLWFLRDQHFDEHGARKLHSETYGFDPTDPAHRLGESGDIKFRRMELDHRLIRPALHMMACPSCLQLFTGVVKAEAPPRLTFGVGGFPRIASKPSLLSLGVKLKSKAGAKSA